MATSHNIAVLGAGSWGTALAVLLAGNGHQVRLWCRREEQALAMDEERSNRRYLSDIPFPESLTATADLALALGAADIVLIVVPSGGFRKTLQALQPLVKPGIRIAWATKGLEHSSQKLLHQVFREEMTDDYGATILSGPTFAMEVARGLPTALTVVSDRDEDAMMLAEVCHNDTFRAYTSKDLVGVQLGGAVKNVLAIAAGVSDGLGFGANARAALITRGLAEMSRLGIALGGHIETFMGLAGLGDLVLTCTDNQSRNRRLGLGLATGKPLEDIYQEIGQVTEGVQTAEEVHLLAKDQGVEMPITDQVYQVLFHGKNPRDAVKTLLLRGIRAEA